MSGDISSLFNSLLLFFSFVGNPTMRKIFPRIEKKRMMFFVAKFNKNFFFNFEVCGKGGIISDLNRIDVCCALTGPTCQTGQGWDIFSWI